LKLSKLFRLQSCRLLLRSTKLINQILICRKQKLSCRFQARYVTGKMATDMLELIGLVAASAFTGGLPLAVRGVATLGVSAMTAASAWKAVNNNCRTPTMLTSAEKTCDPKMRAQATIEEASTLVCGATIAFSTVAALAPYVRFLPARTAPASTVKPPPPAEPLATPTTPAATPAPVPVRTPTASTPTTNAKPPSVLSLPNLSGRTEAEALEELKNIGFVYKSTTKGGYQQFKHPDGSIVWIRPNGEVTRSGPVVLSSEGKKYNPRFDQHGNKINVDKHNTGEFLKIEKPPPDPTP